MAFGKALSIIFMVIFMLVFTSSVHSSRFQGGTDQNRVRASQNLHQVKNLEKGGGSGMEESAREVPTGPDPLHHNNNPTRP